jgi:hypothetical protein
LLGLFSLGSVDHLFRLGVNVMYHEAMYLMVQLSLKTWLNGANFSLDTSFCNQNVRSPAWDNNVIGQHESYFVTCLGLYHLGSPFIECFLSSGNF